jgi:hypothetical protein
MYLDQHTASGHEATVTTTRNDFAEIDTLPSQAASASPLFTRLMTSVNRQRLLLDRCYFQLVSEIAELLSDEEVALLALYLAPPLAAGTPSREHRLALSIMRRRRKGVRHA